MTNPDPSIKEGHRLEDFDYELPAELIAQAPSSVRHESRLMILDRNEGTIDHRTFSSIVDFLEPGDVLVLNDTRVIPARILARRKTGGVVELLLIRPIPGAAGAWEAMASPLKKLKAGEILDVAGDREISIRDFVTADDGGRRVIVNLGGGGNVFELLTTIGNAPLPPYILRQIDSCEGRREVDIDRYQTVFARNPGAVAAPTAGLHFSTEIMDLLEKKGVVIRYITLHVGPGTFKPISSSIDEHSIEAEVFFVPEETCVAVNKAKMNGRRVVACGTTSCRALETAGESGYLARVDAGSSKLYIKPGYEFKIVDGLLTNFHLPRSSLLLLVAAFAGYDLCRKAYEQAVKASYRFYSYGDAMLIS